MSASRAALRARVRSLPISRPVPRVAALCRLVRPAREGTDLERVRGGRPRRRRGLCGRGTGAGGRRGGRPGSPLRGPAGKDCREHYRDDYDDHDRADEQADALSASQACDPSSKSGACAPRLLPRGAERFADSLLTLWGSLRTLFTLANVPETGRRWDARDRGQPRGFLGQGPRCRR